MSLPFPGLGEPDFEAYHPSRAGSNTYVRARIPVKEKLLALGKQLAEIAQSDGVALDVQASDERPSVWNKKSVTAQWVFLWRDRAAREELERAGEAIQRRSAADLLDTTPYYKHAFLALYLDAERFEVCFRIHRDAWADVKNLRERLEREADRRVLLDALRSLAEPFAIGTEGGATHRAHEIDAATVAALLDDADARASWLSVARAFTRGEAIARGAAIADDVTEAFRALLPVYRVMAWRKEEDVANVAAAIARGRSEREAHVRAEAEREAAWQAQHDEQIERRREQALTEARERAEVLEARKRLQSAHSASRAAQVPAREPPREAKPRTVARPATPTPVVDAAAPVIVGARVRIRTGAFGGREGTVTEIDAKGLAKVSFGGLSARVDKGELDVLVDRA